MHFVKRIGRRDLPFRETALTHHRNHLSRWRKVGERAGVFLKSKGSIARFDIVESF